MKEPKLDDLRDEPSPFQNREARNQKQHNWDVLRRFGKAVGGFLTNSISEINNAISDAGDRMDDVEARYNNQIAGNTNLNEIIDSRKPKDKPAFITLGERLNAMPDNEDIMVDVNVNVDGGVQPPFTSALTDFKNTINKDSKIVRIGLNQDLHFMRPTNDPDYKDANNRGLVHIQHMGYLADYIDLMVYNGDSVHGREMKAATTNRIKQVVNTHKLAFGGKPTIWTVGNHDDNNVYVSGQTKIDNTLTLVEMEQAYGINATYGYQDFDNQKLRVIVLSAFENPEKYDPEGNSLYTRDYNSVFSLKQLNWLASDALKVPAGYQVIIFQHCPPEDYGDNKPYPRYRNVNHDVLLSILKAFIAGENLVTEGTNGDYPVAINADFTEQGAGTLIGIICGHEHHDLPLDEKEGIRVIVRTCNAPVGRQIGTAQEDAFDIVEVNPTVRHVKLNRFGAGSSLEFDY